MSGSDREEREQRLAWFDEVYSRAGENADNVPWSRSGPHPGLRHWAAGSPKHTGTAIDIGCGLGDNAEFLSALGYDVTAFDLSPNAIDWARRRFPQSRVTYQTGDLFALPVQWLGAYDLVSEVYTLQALPGDLRRQAVRDIAALVAPGGRIAVVCLGRDEHETTDGPPWRLARSELDGFSAAGLREVSFDDIGLGENESRHFVAVYSRAESG